MKHFTTTFTLEMSFGFEEIVLNCNEVCIPSSVTNALTIMLQEKYPIPRDNAFSFSMK